MNCWAARLLLLSELQNALEPLSAQDLFLWPWALLTLSFSTSVATLQILGVVLRGWGSLYFHVTLNGCQLWAKSQPQAPLANELLLIEGTQCFH